MKLNDNQYTWISWNLSRFWRARSQHLAIYNNILYSRGTWFEVIRSVVVHSIPFREHMLLLCNTRRPIHGSPNKKRDEKQQYSTDIIIFSTTNRYKIKVSNVVGRYPYSVIVLLLTPRPGSLNTKNSNIGITGWKTNFHL